jgi:tetratricopeptide (TPR) repeat protein
MADGVLSGIVGEEEEKADVEGSNALAGTEAFAAAVAARLSAGDPGVARDTSVFLRDQSHLLKIQARHLEEEHAARLHYLLGQAREVDIRRFGLRLRVGFQVFIALLATVIGVGVAIIIQDAITSRNVVVEPFDAPPGLAARGVTGKVVAGGILDELTRLQAATRSSAAARGLSGAWTNNIKLDVPETGISIGEISRLLTQRFGHDVHIDGNLVETPTGTLSLTVRGNSVAPKSFEGPTADLQTLTVAAAEYVYSKSQPSRWAAYLTNVDRNREAVEFCQSALASADPKERPRLLGIWATALASIGAPPQESLALYRAALKLKPDDWVVHTDIQNELMMMGDEQGAWKAGEQMRADAGGRPGRAPEFYYENWDYLTWNLLPWLQATVSDAEENAGSGTNGNSAGAGIADIYARLHDTDAAELALKTTTIDQKDAAGVALIDHVRGRLAAEAGDAATALAEMEKFGAAYADPVVSSNNPGYQCWIAPALEAAGHPEKADALLKTAGSFVDCYRFRADIQDGRGDWAVAQKSYAEAVALAPSLPAAYYSWGLMLAKHDDLDGATAKFKDANQKGPHWADPIKAWGDVLLKQGKRKEALAKYDEALKYAPNWKELKVAREAIANRKT